MLGVDNIFVILEDFHSGVWWYLNNNESALYFYGSVRGDILMAVCPANVIP